MIKINIPPSESILINKLPVKFNFQYGFLRVETNAYNLTFPCSHDGYTGYYKDKLKFWL